MHRRSTSDSRADVLNSRHCLPGTFGPWRIGDPDFLYVPSRRTQPPARSEQGSCWLVADLIVRVACYQHALSTSRQLFAVELAVGATVFVCSLIVSHVL